MEPDKAFVIDTRTDAQILFPDLEDSKEVVLSQSPQPIEEDQEMEIMRKETEELKPGSQKKLQTRRQSKGLTYFNRLKPKVTIDIGSLEDWYTERTLQPLSKRRRLNVTVDDVDSGSDQSSESDEEMIELNKTVEHKLDKSLLYENWQVEFEKQKKLQNKKKRKRDPNSSSVRSKSRSPSPIKTDPL